MSHFFGLNQNLGGNRCTQGSKKGKSKSEIMAAQHFISVGLMQTVLFWFWEVNIDTCKLAMS